MVKWGGYSDFVSIPEEWYEAALSSEVVSSEHHFPLKFYLFGSLTCFQAESYMYKL